MNLYQQNIKKLESRGVDPKVYYLDKLAEECLELHVECERLLNKKHMLEDYGDMEEFNGEFADVINCIIYIIILFFKSKWSMIKSEMKFKLNRALERD